MAGKPAFEQESVYDQKQRPEHGQNLVQDALSGHYGDKHDVKEHHKGDITEKTKPEMSAESKFTHRELEKLNHAFQQYLPEGSQIVGHGKGQGNHEYLFVKPNKDSKDIYAVDPDTGKPAAHYRVENHKWVQIGQNHDGGETKSYSDHSKVTTDKQGLLIDSKIKTAIAGSKVEIRKAPELKLLDAGAIATFVNGKMSELDTPNGGKRMYEYGDKGDPHANGLTSIKLDNGDSFSYDAGKQNWTHHSKSGDTQLAASPYTDDKTGDFTYKAESGWSSTLRGNGSVIDRDEQFRVSDVVDASGQKTSFDYSKDAQHPSVKLPDGTSWDWDSTFGDYRSGSKGAFERHPQPFKSMVADHEGNIVCTDSSGMTTVFKSTG